MFCGIIIRNNLLVKFKKQFKNVPKYSSFVILQRDGKKCTYTFDGINHYDVSINDFNMYYFLMQRYSF